MAGTPAVALANCLPGERKRSRRVVAGVEGGLNVGPSIPKLMTSYLVVRRALIYLVAGHPCCQVEGWTASGQPREERQTLHRGCRCARDTGTLARPGEQPTVNDETQHKGPYGDYGQDSDCR